jgi:hypothetical protein
MPPRLLSLAVVVAWVGMSSWLLYRDLWPLIRPGEAPPFTIDFADEVLAKRPPIHWTVSKNGKAIYVEKTEITYDPQLNQFEMTSELKPRPGLGADVPLAERLTMRSLYVVSHEGDLRKTSVTISLPALGEATVEGDVRDDRFYSHVSVPLFGMKKDLEPVEVTGRGTALNPLQPWDRLPNLRPGQRWRLPLSEPLMDALSGLIPGIAENSLRMLDAEVLAKEENLSFAGKDEPCLIIEYTGEDAHGRTWVRASDGTVLRQEFSKGLDDWVMQREP